MKEIITKLPDMEKLRMTIWDEIQRLKNKESTPSEANAVFNGSAKYLSTYKLEIDAQRYIARGQKLNSELFPQIEEGVGKAGDKK